jgi:osmotically-inducible protein OsmY
MAADSDIRQRVEERLRGESRVDINEIEISVRDATVYLTGAVDSAWEKRVARTSAQEVDGVAYVHDHMTVKNFVRRPDNELAEAVQNAIMRDAYAQGGKVEVRASSGEIVLDGEVPTYDVRKAAEHVAWFTPGVINVENLLLVTDEDFVDVSPLEVTDSA